MAFPRRPQISALRRNDKAFANFRNVVRTAMPEKDTPLPCAFSDMESTKDKVKDKHRGKYNRKRETPIIETNYRQPLDSAEVRRNQEYMHRPLQGDPKEVTLSRKRRVGMPISCEIEDTPKVLQTRYR